MATKLEKNRYPSGCSAEDFQCFGPPAVTDGQFDTVKIADLGCFDQSGKDSNKYYHAAVVKNKTTGTFFAYFEWGRTGATSPSFQFIECSSEAEAQKEFSKQLHEKNDKRGQWVTVAGRMVLQAKPGKDCYLVRSLATRSTGLPDAKTIKHVEGFGATKPADDDKKSDKNAKNQPKKLAAAKIDRQTLELMRDLSVATVAYTRGAMADSSLPTQTAIQDARDFLQEAQRRLVQVGDDVNDQVNDGQLVHLTQLMYGRIPKKKALHAPPADWILNKGNIMLWQADLDAFEAALVAHGQEADKTLDSSPFGDLPIHMEWIDPKTDLGKFLHSWWPKATANRHGGIGTMKIKNLWRVERHGDHAKLISSQDRVLAENPKVRERPLFQPNERPDLGNDSTLAKRWRDTNTSLLFHGTRSVNVSGILREALRLPKQLVGVVITGAAFGGGIYWADDWKKSAGYTSMCGSYWSYGGGGVQGREAFMFAGDVTLGQPFVAPGSRGYTGPPANHHSIFGKAGHSGVMNNEWIIFDARQNELKYLAEFSA